jgi:anti-sigma regulatory factor (Ser/Thr protein kinase)
VSRRPAVGTRGAMESAITELGVTRQFRRMAEAVPAARAFVRRWLPDSEHADGLVVAAAEALNNVVDHAVGDTFTVAVDLDETVATVTVVDVGPGFDVPDDPEMPDAFAGRCRGLAMMHVLADGVDIVSSPAGTIVTLTHEFAPVREHIRVA